MPNTIKVRRGVRSSLPTLEAGEFAFTTDTKEVFIGDGANNYEMAKKKTVEEAQILVWLGV